MKTYPAPGTEEFSDFLIGILAEGIPDAPDRERSKGRAIPSGTFSAISQTSSVAEGRDEATGIPGCALSAEAPVLMAETGEKSRLLSGEIFLGLTILELEASVVDAEIKNGCYGKGWAK